MSTSNKQHKPATGLLAVLVADEAIAKLMGLPEPGADLVEIEAQACPTAHAREADLQHDAHGRRAASGSSGESRGQGNSTVSAGESERHIEAAKFARQVAASLSLALRAKRFERLHIVAAPRFLGLLRKEIGKDVAAVVEHELAKDLIHLNAAALTAHLFPKPQKA